MRRIVAKKKYRYPMGLEREYAKQLAGLTDAMFRTIKKDVPQMVGLVKRNQITMDADDPNEDLDKLMNDDKVKAVVLRINSPGGSAFASEQMWNAIELLKSKKPLFRIAAPNCSDSASRAASER